MSFRTAAIVCVGVACLAMILVADSLASDNPPGGGSSRNISKARGRQPLKNDGEKKAGGFDEVRVEYRRVLETVAAGAKDGVENGVDDICELQRAVFQDGSLAGLAKLHRYQLAMITALGARDPQAVRPIVWLHYEAVRKHVGAKGWAIRVPSLILAADMASSMRRVARTPEDSRFATNVMVCSGYTFLDDGNKERAVGVFEKVAIFDPKNASALLGAAAVHERYGRYPQAVKHLRRIVEAHPSDDEGRLRLAVNLARLKEGEASLEVLEDLVKNVKTDWVEAVARQELARRLMAMGRLDRALASLQEAVRLVPDDSSLRVQLALALDLSGRPGESARVIESIGPAMSQRGQGPRWQYAVWPEFDLANLEKRLRRQADSATPALAKMLDLTAEGRAS